MTVNYDGTPAQTAEPGTPNEDTPRGEKERAQEETEKHPYRMRYMEPHYRAKPKKGSEDEERAPKKPTVLPIYEDGVGIAWRSTVRKQIEHEDNLINHRTSWLLSSQAFLFVAYGTMFAFAKFDPDKFESFQKVIYGGVVCAIGIWISMVTFKSIRDANDSILALASWWNERFVEKPTEWAAGAVAEHPVPPIMWDRPGGTSSKWISAGTGTAWGALLLFHVYAYVGSPDGTAQKASAASSASASSAPSSPPSAATAADTRVAWPVPVSSADGAQIHDAGARRPDGGPR